MGKDGMMTKSASLGNFMQLSNDEDLAADQAHLFMINKLTSLAPSGVQGMFLGSGSSKPQAKFDPQSGKWYRSFTVDRSLGSLSLDALATALSSEALCFNEVTQSGVVMNLAGSLQAGGEVSFLCVGDNHVHADHLHRQGLGAIAKLCRGNAEQSPARTATVADSTCGVTLFSAPEGAPSMARMQADGACGFNLLFKAAEQQESASHKQGQAGWGGSVQADYLCGLTMLSSTEAAQADVLELEADGVAGMTLFNASGATAAPVSEVVAAESVAGMTVFGRASSPASQAKPAAAPDAAEAGFGGLEADSSCGVLMLSRPEGAEESLDADTMAMDSCAGFMLLNPLNPAPPAAPLAGKRAVAADSLAGVTLFSAQRNGSSDDALSEQDTASGVSRRPSSGDAAWATHADSTAGVTLLSWEREEPLCTEDVTAMLSSFATGCAGITLFSRAGAPDGALPSRAVQSSAGVTLFA